MRFARAFRLSVIAGTSWTLVWCGLDYLASLAGGERTWGYHVIFAVAAGVSFRHRYWPTT